MKVLVSILILINLLIGSDARRWCQKLELSDFPNALSGEWETTGEREGGAPVYVQQQRQRYMFRFEDKSGAKHWAIGLQPGKRGKNILMRRPGAKTEGDKKGGVECQNCDFKQRGRKGWVPVPGIQTVRCIGGKGKLMMLRSETDASAMMEGDAVTEQSASGLSSADFMMMAAGAAVGALLVAVAVAVVVAMRKRKSAKRTEMEMTEAVHVPDSSVMTPDATEKKAEGDEVTVSVSVSMDDEAVQVDA